jgi:hypothetical protein
MSSRKPKALPAVVAWRRAVLASDLTTRDKAVAWALSDHWNPDGTTLPWANGGTGTKRPGAGPSYSTLATLASCSKRGAMYSVAALEARGFVVKTYSAPRYRAGRDTNRWIMATPTGTPRREDDPYAAYADV